MKTWLLERVLPMWAKQTVLAQLKDTQRENRKLTRRLRELEAYVKGLHRGLRGGGKWTS